MSFAWTAYRILAPCLGAVAPAARTLVSPHERPYWSERLGAVALEGGAHAWVHAASLGEASAVGPLVRELLALQPRGRLFLTANTRTGRARLEGLGLPVSLAPIDSPQAVRSFFAGVEPQRVLVVETEIWPHWLLRAQADRVPVALVSARLSERSVHRYRKLGTPLRRVLAGLAAVLCQTSADRDRWLRLGAPPERTLVMGNLKHDAVTAAAISREAARSDLELERDRPLLVLGSVRPGEMRILAHAWTELPVTLRERWQVAVVPRHARATAELRAEAHGLGIAATRNGCLEEWLWDDRAGMLNRYYAAADVAFVGGSLVDYGGHNPLEPAATGAAVLMGAHHASQADAVRTLLEGGGIQIVESAAELVGVFTVLLSDEERRARLGDGALRVAEGLRGAARRTVAQLAAWGFWPAE